MPTNIIPPQDPRYADSGRREAVIGTRSYPCAILELPPEHPDRNRCSHIVTMRWVAIRPGVQFTANGVPYTAVQVRDPNRDGLPNMARRYIEILCNIVKET